ncbi:MAG: thermonuclease family protein [Pseudomonadota bacterium]
MSSFWPYGLAVLALVGLVLWLARPVRGEFQPEAHSGHVRHVVDGDTFYLLGHNGPIRLWGIDAPELDQAGGEASKRALEALLSRGAVSCHFIGTDRYGRRVARCFLEDGRDVGQLMIARGHARELCRYSRGAYGGCST